MIKHIKGHFQLIIYSNLFTGWCACCLSFSSFYFGNNIPHGNDIAVIIAIGVFMALGYQFPYTYDKTWLTNGTRLTWICTHYRNIKILVMLEITVFTLLLFQLHWLQIILFIHLAIIGWCYYQGFTWREKHYTLRNLPYTKTLTITYVWAMSTVTIPLATTLTNSNIHEIFILLLMQMTLVGSLCLIFDLRDKVQDSQNKVPTLPVKFGPKITYTVIFSLLGIYVFASVFAYGISIFSISLTLIAVWILKLLQWQQYRKDDFFYLVLVDGTMTIPALVSLLLNSEMLDL